MSSYHIISYCIISYRIFSVWSIRWFYGTFTNSLLDQFYLHLTLAILYCSHTPLLVLKENKLPIVYSLIEPLDGPCSCFLQFIIWNLEFIIWDISKCFIALSNLLFGFYINLRKRFFIIFSPNLLSHWVWLGSSS